MELTQYEKNVIISALKIVPLKGNLEEVAQLTAAFQSIIAKLTAVEPLNQNGETKEKELVKEG